MSRYHLKLVLTNSGFVYVDLLGRYHYFFNEGSIFPTTVSKVNIRLFDKVNMTKNTENYSRLMSSIPTLPILRIPNDGRP